MSHSFLDYWGKASLIDTQNRYSFHLLPYHSLDVAAVAWHLLAPNGRRSRDMASRTGLSQELIRYIIVLALILHDLGKFSKTFQSLVLELFHRLFPGRKPMPYVERHDTLGFLVWRGNIKDDPNSVSWLIRQKTPVLAELLGYFIKSSFGHHGLPPKESAQGGSQILRAKSFFDSDDISAIHSFVQNCLFLMGEAPPLAAEGKAFKEVLKEISWQIAGLAVLADWIGSNSEYFPYHSESMSLDEYWNKLALPQAAKALADVGWMPSKVRAFSGIASLISLFPFIHEPTPLQALATDIALMDGPKLFIIEDVTGAGKTEAATVLAARMMSAGEADGIYIGLPTMATANAMYERMQNAYLRLFAETERPSLILSHGARHLLDKFSETVSVHKQEQDHLYGAENTASAVCNEWYADNRKKALLADVGVGTIDQALMGVLPARHQSLRLLGLQRKILIVDEVHAYDPYMEHILGVLLEAHARGGGSAILLSATIPKKKRTELAKAFLRGLSSEGGKFSETAEPAFPLLMQASLSGVKSYPVKTRREVQRSVRSFFLNSYEKVLQTIEEIAASGECVCWIRNTVRDARKAFFDLKTRGILPSERLHLFHSRFAMVDRARIEANVINNFGKNSGQIERKGRVLIATQVVEQSLDLDFDQLISDLAPIDLVIQRAGRLHRHIRDQFGNRIEGENTLDGRASPTMHIFAPEFEENADNAWLSGDFSGTAAVYPNIGNLWRTYKILLEKQGWRMPEDARELIELVYGNGSGFDVPEGLIDKVVRAIGKDQSKESMGHLNALILERGYCRNAVQADQWNEDDRVPTRLTDENIEVALAIVSDNGEIYPYADAERYAWDWSCLSISLRDWTTADYRVPSKYEDLVENLKTNNPRLKYTEVVVVAQRSGKALSSNQSISNIYDPRLGWGEVLSKEE